MDQFGILSYSFNASARLSNDLTPTSSLFTYAPDSDPSR